LSYYPRIEGYRSRSDSYPTAASMLSDLVVKRNIVARMGRHPTRRRQLKSRDNFGFKSRASSPCTGRPDS
ncbi:MAG: hypothetical protein WCP68_03060, partial [Enhydrobacter sp.]